MDKKTLIKDDCYYMKKALRQAENAALIDEVPVGAVIVHEGRVIASAFNRRITQSDATAHAEILALRKAGKKLNNWRLDGCTIYVTLEPCAMCAGALVNSRIKRLVYGARDVRFGCCGSIYDIPRDTAFNHRLEAEGGVLENECSEILSKFFRIKRHKPQCNTIDIK